MGHFILGVIISIVAVFVWNELIAPPLIRYSEGRTSGVLGIFALPIVALCEVLQWVQALLLIAMMGPLFIIALVLVNVRPFWGQPDKERSTARLGLDRSRFA